MNNEHDEGWESEDRSWIASASGGKIHPFDLRDNEIDIEDIATGLATMNRFAGRTFHFDSPYPYSVAQHSVLCCWAAPIGPVTRLAVLTHDIEEAYPPGDLPRPFKRDPRLAGLVDLQKRIRTQVCDRYGISWWQADNFKEIDNRMLATERRDLSPDYHPDWSTTFEPYQFRITPWHPRVARRTFLFVFRSLMDELTATLSSRATTPSRV